MQSINHIVFFDGICNLCNSSVQKLIAMDKKNRLFFAPLQSQAANHYLKEIDCPDSIVFYDRGQIYTMSTAVLKILKLMGFPYSLSVVFFIVPRFLRDAVYQYIAKNRYKWYGKRAVCMVPTQELKERFLV